MTLQTSRVAGGRNHRSPRRTLRDLPAALLLLLPAVLVLGVFNVYPAIDSLYLSFFEWNGISPTKEAVGLDNYRTIFGSRQVTAPSEFIFDISEDLLSAEEGSGEPGVTSYIDF